MTLLVHLLQYQLHLSEITDTNNNWYGLPMNKRDVHEAECAWTFDCLILNSACPMVCLHA